MNAKSHRYRKDYKAIRRVVQQKEHKVLHVSHANAVVDPRAVVVHFENTPIADSRDRKERLRPTCSDGLSRVCMHCTFHIVIVDFHPSPCLCSTAEHNGARLRDW